MARSDRVKIIKELSEARGKTNVITYVTSIRPGINIQMAGDQVRYLYNVISGLNVSKKECKVDLFVCSNGGDVVVPWRVINLIREFSSELTILVPHRAYSAATLLALGADKIIMHPMGELGPIDPAFNIPIDPKNPASGFRQLNVEDVTSFMELINEDFKINHEEEVVEAVKLLAQQVTPLDLGTVKRTHSQARMLARKLLLKHMPKEQEQKIEQIIDTLKTKLFYHGHPIVRNEAIELGLKVEKDPDQDVIDLMWKLYLEYEKEMQSNKTFVIYDEFNKASKQKAVLPLLPPPNVAPFAEVSRSSEEKTEQSVDQDVQGTQASSKTTNKTDVKKVLKSDDKPSALPIKYSLEVEKAEIKDLKGVFIENIEKNYYFKFDVELLRVGPQNFITQYVNGQWFEE